MMAKDHLGNVYSSITEMCRQYGISFQSYKSRINHGWTQEEALTGNHLYIGRSKKCMDHLGNEYKSIRQMCEAWGITEKAYEGRMRRNWTLEEILTGKEHVFSTAKPCIDHLGKQYSSIIEMCDAWNVTKAAYAWRVNNGWTLEQALTGNKEKTFTNSKECKDHNSNRYSSVSEMCRAWNIKKATYDYRISCGWNLKDALTFKPRECMDHLGNTYKSTAQMCIFWGVTRSAYEKRIKAGWTLEDALTGKDVIYFNAKRCTDHLGIEYPTILEMCKKWRIPRSAFDSRITDGWTLEEALTIPRNYSLGEHRISEILRDYQVAGYFDYYFHDITIKKVFDSLNLLSSYNSFMDTYEKELNNSGIFFTKRRFSKFRFDFSLIKGKKLFAFIEYDGEQHFKYIELFFKTLNDFLLRQQHDIAKNTFSESNGIPLLRIRFDQISEKSIRYMINDLLSNPQKYVHKHNTFLSNDEYMKAFKNHEYNGKIPTDNPKPQMV